MYKEFKKYFKFPLFKPFGEPVILTERYDTNKIKWILNNKKIARKQMRDKLFEKDKTDPFELLEEYFKKSPNGIMKVNYEYFSHEKIGRLNAIQPVTMQTIPREFRHTLTRKRYDDLDMVNAHPTILNAICIKFNINHKFLNQYIRNREEILEDLVDKNNFERKDIKTLILEILNGGYAYYESVKVKTPWLLGYFKEIQNILIELSKLFPVTYRQAKKFKLHRGTIYNIEGSTVNTILSTIENYILMGICEFYKKNGLLKKELILEFDGIIFPKNKKNKLLLEKCEKFIFAVFKIYMKLKIKPIDEYIRVSI